MDALALHSLEQSLEARLNDCQLALTPVTVQVRASLDADRLILTVQSYEPVMLHPRRTFGEIRGAIAQLQLDQQYQVLIYLLVSAQAALPDEGLPVLSFAKISNPQILPESPAEIPPAPPIDEPEMDRLAVSKPAVEIVPPDAVSNAVPLTEVAIAPADPVLETKFPLNPLKISFFAKNGPSWGLPPMLLWGAATAGLGALALLGYGFSRPCVLGPCPQLLQAQRQLGEPFSAQSLAQLQRLEAQLSQRQQQLQAIPPWSPHAHQASQLRQDYRQRLHILQPPIAALEAGAAAQAASPAAPAPAAQWQASRQHWQQAIAQLEAIPNASPFAPLLAQKQREYQQQLASVEAALVAEQESDRRLQAAQEAAQRAESQQNSARTLSDWIGAESAWQEAIAQVRAIPSQTSGYQRKKEILADYLAKLVVVRQHQQQEEQALNFYNQSAQRAAQAKTLQSKQEWSAALAQWRSAIAALEQVPETSELHSAAQSRLISYQQALEQLDFQEQAAQRRQQAAGDLEKTCSGTPRICQYQIGNPIRVTLTAAYEQQVEQTALSAQQESDRQISAELLAHLESLESSFVTIANNAGVAIQVYDAQGQAIVTYSP